LAESEARAVTGGRGGWHMAGLKAAAKYRMHYDTWHPCSLGPCITV